MEQQLLAVFEHYGLPEPGYGERSIKCPAHDDRVPSASVNRQKGLWHCHACGAGGGPIALVQAMEQGSYEDARRMVESLSGSSTKLFGAFLGVLRVSGGLHPGFGRHHETYCGVSWLDTGYQPRPDHQRGGGEGRG